MNKVTKRHNKIARLGINHLNGARDSKTTYIDKQKGQCKLQ